jgi:hypothetical protein
MIGRILRGDSARERVGVSSAYVTSTVRISARDSARADERLGAPPQAAEALPAVAGLDMWTQVSWQPCPRTRGGELRPTPFPELLVIDGHLAGGALPRAEDHIGEE